MTLQVSTMFKEKILGAYSFADIFAYGQIRIYSGTQPTSADAAATGTLLATVTEDGAGGGILFQQYGAFMSISSTQDWRMAVTSTGTAGWFRIVQASGDTGDVSYSLPRIDGSIGTTADDDMTLQTTSLTAGQSIAVQQFLFTFPPII